MISLELSNNELQAVHAVLRDKISALNGVPPFVKHYRNMLEGVDLKVKIAMNIAFGITKEAHNESDDKPANTERSY